MDNLSEADKQKLKHEALQGASQELRKKKEDEETAADVDELQGDWEQADEYSQFMSKT